VLLRAFRAVGLACDAHGGLERARVDLTSGGAAAIEARSLAGRVVFEMDGALVERSAPATLLEMCSDALDRASTLDGEPDASRGPETGASRVLLLENPFTDPDRTEQGPRSIACGTFQLASALRHAGIDVTLVGGAFDPGPVEEAAGDGRGVLVGITLLEACLEQVRKLAAHIAAATDAVVACGGPMATLTPEHAAAHLPGVRLFVRGPGEMVLPTLVKLLAAGDHEALMDLDGVLYLDDGLLVAGHLGRVCRVDPDETVMDFGLYEKHHLGGGLSIETSRGCTNPCLFCTTPERGAHHGRSGAVMARHLASYARRLEELHGDAPPRPSRRVHICDDDFTCDSRQAIDVLGAIGRSGFEISSFQASVRDFIVRDREERRLDVDLLDAIRPSLFQDAQRFADLAREKPLGRPPSDVASFVHLGVESLDDGDLRRLGKGYRARDVSRLVTALDERGIVHDAYLILSGPGTTLDGLATTFLEMMRLKLEHPRTFFIRIPVVPFVVPVFPSGSYRAWHVKHERGEADGDIELNRVLTVEGFAEFDYPVVRRGVPSDPDVREACEAWEEIVDPDPRYFAPAENLAAWLRARLPGIEDDGRAARVRRVIRRLSTAGRRTVYRGIALARRGEIDGPRADACWSAAETLGPAEQVADEARKAMEAGDPRLVVIPTHDCSLRCSYCPMDKREGLLMDEQTLDRSMELLLSSEAENVILQFFGGEALLRRDFVLSGMDRAMAMASDAGKHIGFILSTNGVSLDDELIDRIRGLPVKVELSIDGTPEVHNANRRPKEGGFDSYETATRCARTLAGSSIPHEVIMVVTPSTVQSLSASFDHVASLGFQKIQVNHALAVTWRREHKEAFARELSAIEQAHYSDSIGQNGAELIDLRTFRRPMLLNGEITVDHDGTIYYGNGFLVRTADASRFRTGHLDDLENMDAYLMRRRGNDFLIEHTYPAEMARNNHEVGRIFGSFVQHMRKRFPDLATPESVRSPGSGHPR